jgi:hypothetical protein
VQILQMQALNISSQSEADRLAAVFLYDSLLLRAQERKELQARESRKRGDGGKKLQTVRKNFLFCNC